jgi:hypothetical protein
MMAEMASNASPLETLAWLARAAQARRVAGMLFLVRFAM